MKSHIALLMVGLLISISSFNQSKFVKPEDFFGFAPGSDRNLFNYEKLIEYLKIADASSDRLEISQVGYSPMGKPMYIAFISSLANIAQLDELREINKELTINPELSVKEQENLVQQGRVFLMATLSMHSSEVGHAQSAPLTVSDLCNTTDPLKLEWMDNVVYMMIPNHNPDGMNMVVDYFLETKGAKYEGASQPGVYHKTSVPNFDMDRRVIGVIPENNILMSGYCENEEKIGNNPVMIWMSKGKGEIILMAFNPKFRSSTHVTYKLLFNSICF